ncbi:hypothetical protein GBA52_012451 [Prunus armeniaca]|nr:hypothetical protein GBA52_012451 [Prunus armeniaca]
MATTNSSISILASSCIHGFSSLPRSPEKKGSSGSRNRQYLHEKEKPYHFHSSYPP